jgi:hypothetical protein
MECTVSPCNFYYNPNINKIILIYKSGPPEWLLIICCGCMWEVKTLLIVCNQTSLVGSMGFWSTLHPSGRSNVYHYNYFEWFYITTSFLQFFNNLLYVLVSWLLALNIFLNIRKKQVSTYINVTSDLRKIEIGSVYHFVAFLGFTFVKVGNGVQSVHGGIQHTPDTGGIRHTPYTGGIRHTPYIGGIRHTPYTGGIRHTPLYRRNPACVLRGSHPLAVTG